MITSFAIMAGALTLSGIILKAKDAYLERKLDDIEVFQRRALDVGMISLIVFGGIFFGLTIAHLVNPFSMTVSILIQSSLYLGISMVAVNAFANLYMIKTALYPSEPPPAYTVE